jgi:superfamily II RNA helicase
LYGFISCGCVKAKEQKLRMSCDVFQIPCELEDQLAGLVEAWASGVTWKELMMGCNMDEGDLARLLRRTIDLLAQVGFPL